MVQRIRSFFRTSETGVAVTVGVVGGLALYYAFTALVNAFVLGYLVHHQDGGLNNVPLEVEILGAHFDYQQLIVNGIALVLLAVVGDVLFLWRGGEPAGAALKTRECPECKSDIWADARRCPHCTSAVTPLVDDTVAS
ncbi:MAG TPA: hypothetical protein VIE40_07990 [Dehalococcoidia bacterium]